jgi:hypothetical protein
LAPAEPTGRNHDRRRDERWNSSSEPEAGSTVGQVRHRNPRPR